MSVSGELTDRTVVVTGAAGGLGSAVAHAVSRAGAFTIVSDLEGDAFDQSVERLTAGGRVEALAADVSTAGGVATLAEHVRGRRGRLHGLVHCAGVNQTVPFRELDPTDVSRMMQINFESGFHLTQQLAEVMVTDGSASIVHLSSVAGRSGRADSAHYAASKAALISLTRSAALAYGPLIRVNAICPGVFMTPMWERIIDEHDRVSGDGAGRRYLDEVMARVPLRRMGRAEEVGAVALFLLGSASSYLTGQSLNVDGGLEMD